MAETDLAELLSRAQDVHVAVIGGGIAGLVSALEFAKIGMRVTLWEAADHLGGTIREAEIDGLTVDVGPDSYPDRSEAVRELVKEVGLDGAVVTANAEQAWIAGLPSGAAPLPKDTLLGVPQNPWAEDVRRVIGWRGAWRAYLDRLRPPVTIGQEHSLGRLVRSRMGPRVCERLMAPLSVGGFAVLPDEVDVDVVAPGLNARLTQVGWLAGAVARQRAEHSGSESFRGAGGLRGIDGGLVRLIDALEAKLEELGATVHRGSLVHSLSRDDSGRWVIGLDPAMDADRGASDANVGGGARGESDVQTSNVPDLTADAVILATGQAESRKLLEPILRAKSESALASAGSSGAVSPGVGKPGVGSLGVGTPLEVITLLVRAPALDVHPRGAVVYPVPGTFAASALVHATARWTWLAEAAGTSNHVLRLVFGGPGIQPASQQLSDDRAQELALVEASTLLGVPLTATELRGMHRASFTLAPSASTLGHADRTEAIRTALKEVPGLAVVGSWMSGSGIAQVVPDAQQQADRIRHEMLWRTGADARKGIHD